MGHERDHCYVAERLAERLGSSACVVRAVGQVFERWDGGGRPGGLGGEDLDPAARLAVLAGDAEVLTRAAGIDRALEVLDGERGRHHDPVAVDALHDAIRPWVADLDAASGYDLLMAEAPPAAPVPADALTHLLTAVVDFADLKVPSLAGHSRA